MGRCSARSDEAFVLFSDGTVRLATMPGLCLSVFLRGPAAQVGDPAGLYPCAASGPAWSQRFASPADGTIRFVGGAVGSDALCLSVFLQGDEAEEGDEVGLYSCTG